MNDDATAGHLVIADFGQPQSDRPGNKYLGSSAVPANGSFGGGLSEEEIALMEGQVAVCIADLLDTLLIGSDHNTEGTPDRVARMLVREVFAGRYAPRPELTTFPNVAHLDQIYMVGPIAVRSCCAHHLVPIIGQAWVGMIPDQFSRLIGLSKIHRLTEWIMARPQIQEEATQMLADELEAATSPRALGVVVRAKHFCCAWRGVRDDPSLMTTSVMRGLFKDDPRARAEFMSLIGGMGFTT
jgi:GTP cyclohydrolase IA